MRRRCVGIVLGRGANRRAAWIARRSPADWRAHARKSPANWKGALTAEGDETSRREQAERLGMSEGAVKVAVHRLRARYGTALREAIAGTVATQEEVEDEIRALFEALG